MACPRCEYPNDERFRFCQNCGYNRKTVVLDKDDGLKLKHKVDEEQIAARVNELIQTRNTTRCAKQKTALEVEFSRFLLSLSCQKTLSSALPSDVVAFLVWKDQDGRTLVHKPSCEFVSQRKGSQCDCPKRLAFGTVDSLIGKLRAIFVQHGRGAEWLSILGVGNPASSRSVKYHLANVREEQLRARVTPRQADPVLLSDIEVLSRYIQSKLRNPT